MYQNIINFFYFWSSCTEDILVEVSYIFKPFAYYLQE